MDKKESLSKELISHLSRTVIKLGPCGGLAAIKICLEEILEQERARIVAHHLERDEASAEAMKAIVACIGSVTATQERVVLAGATLDEHATTISEAEARALAGV